MRKTNIALEMTTSSLAGPAVTHSLRVRTFDLRLHALLRVADGGGIGNWWGSPWTVPGKNKYSVRSDAMWRTVLFCTVCVAANYFQGGTDLVSAPCLGCICEAATGCDLRFNCTRGLCGPLLISETYWRDAGRCTLQGDNPNWDGAFHRCVTDAWCAAWTVRNYMARHAQDCNRDGLLGCTDFALLHYLGASRCGARDVENLRFMRSFTECRSAISRLNG